MGMSLDTQPVMDPLTLYEQCVEQRIPTGNWWGKANFFRSPRSGTYGDGMLLMVRRDLNQLLKTEADNNVPYHHELTIQFNDSTVILKKIVILKSTCLTPDAPHDTAAVHLVRVADRRYHLSRIPLNKMYNVRDAGGSYIGDSLKENEEEELVPWTWAEIVEDIWGVLNTDAQPISDIPELPDNEALSVNGEPDEWEPDGTPEGFDFTNDNAWLALNVVCDRIGCAVCYDPIRDRFYIERLATESLLHPNIEHNAVNREVPRIWLDDGHDPTRPMIPQKVRVVFQISPPSCHSQFNVDHERDDEELTDDPDPMEDVPADEVRDEDSLHSLPDDAYALGSAPTNEEDLDARALERVKDYYRILLSNMDGLNYVFPFPVAYRVSHEIPVVIWEDRGRGVLTSIYRGLDVYRPFQIFEEWYKPEPCGGGGGSVCAAPDSDTKLLWPQILDITCGEGGATITRGWVFHPPAGYCPHIFLNKAAAAAYARMHGGWGGVATPFGPTGTVGENGEGTNDPPTP